MGSLLWIEALENKLGHNRSIVIGLIAGLVKLFENGDEKILIVQEKSSNNRILVERGRSLHKSEWTKPGVINDFTLQSFEYRSREFNIGQC